MQCHVIIISTFGKKYAMIKLWRICENKGNCAIMCDWQSTFWFCYLYSNMQLVGVVYLDINVFRSYFETQTVSMKEWIYTHTINAKRSIKSSYIILKRSISRYAWQKFHCLYVVVYNAYFIIRQTDRDILRNCHYLLFDWYPQKNHHFYFSHM